MSDNVRELLATEVALAKLARREITRPEAEQLLRPSRDHREPSATRRALSARTGPVIGRTDGGRPLTLVIEATLEPTTWILVTGWESTAAERRILGHR